MSSDTNLRFSLEIDGAEHSAKNLTELRSILKNLKSDFEKADLGSEKFNNLKKAIKETEGTIKSASKATSDNAKATEEAAKTTKEATKTKEGFISKLKSAITTGTGFGKAMAGVNDVIKKNPILFLVGVLGSLWAMLKNVQPIVDLLSEGMGAFNSVVDVAVNRIKKLVEAAQLFASGDLKGAASAASDAVSGFGAACLKAAEDGRQLVKAQKEIDDAFQVNALTIKENETALAGLYKQLNDKTKSDKERLKIAEDIQKLEDKNFELQEAKVKGDRDLARQRLINSLDEADQKKAMMMTDKELIKLGQDRAAQDALLNDLATKSAALQDKRTEAEGKSEKVAARTNMIREQSDEKRRKAEEKRQKDAEAAAVKADKLLQAEIKAAEDAATAKLNFQKELYTSGIIDKETLAKRELEIESAKTNELKLIAEKRGQDTSTIEQKLLDLKIKNYDADVAATKKKTDEQTQLEEKRLENANKSGLAALQAEVIRNGNSLEAKLNLLEEEKRQALAVKDLTEGEKLKIEAEYIEKAEQMRTESLQRSLSTVQSFVSMASNAINAINEADTARIEDEKQKQLQANQERLDADLSNTKLSEDQKVALKAEAKAKEEEINAQTERKKKQLAKDSADTQFAITAAQIISGTAQAIMQALAQLGPIAGGLAAVAIGATGAIQLDVANKQRQAVKAFARGGIINGPSHAQGGVKYDLGGQVVELEGNEGVINKRSMSMPGVKAVASYLNQLGGGIKFASGGETPGNSVVQHSGSSNTGGLGDVIKVYVTESDISNTQNRVNTIRARAKV